MDSSRSNDSAVSCIWAKSSWTVLRAPREKLSPASSRRHSKYVAGEKPFDCSSCILSTWHTGVSSARTSSDHSGTYLAMIFLADFEYKSALNMDTAWMMRSRSPRDASTAFVSDTTSESADPGTGAPAARAVRSDCVTVARSASEHCIGQAPSNLHGTSCARAISTNTQRAPCAGEKSRHTYRQNSQRLRRESNAMRLPHSFPAELAQLVRAALMAGDQADAKECHTIHTCV
jgi:hypothetical protein